jgi:hypothetical protein
VSSSRRARRRRRHQKYGKPSYPSLPKNGLTPTAVTTDEWISPHFGEEKLPRVITSEMIDWGESYLSYDTVSIKLKKEEPFRKLRTKYLLD